MRSFELEILIRDMSSTTHGPPETISRSLHALKGAFELHDFILS